MKAKNNICGLSLAVTKPQPLRKQEEVRADILSVEKEAEGMLAEIIGGGL